jgi:hypothetical protein
MNETQFFELLQAVLHGDQEHRNWLSEAFHAAWESAHGNPTPVPPPRGSGTKDRLYAELLDTQRKLANALTEIESLTTINPKETPNA